MKRFLGKTVTSMIVLASIYSVSAYAGESTPSNDGNVAYVMEFNISQDAQMELLHIGTPRYNLIKQMIGMLSIDSNRIADIHAECEAYEAAEVTVTAILQKEDSNGNWRDMKTFSDSVSGEKLASVRKKYAVTQGRYRLEITGKIDNGASSESSTKYTSEKTCYNEF